MPREPAGRKKPGKARATQKRAGAGKSARAKKPVKRAGKTKALASPLIGVIRYEIHALALQGLSPVQTATAAEQNRARAIAMLDKKRRALFDAMEDLLTRRRGAQQADRLAIDHTRTDTQLEIDRVESRLATVAGTGSFRVPTADQQTALLAAIRAVGAAADANAAIGALIRATIKLVNTYKAQDT